MAKCWMASGNSLVRENHTARFTIPETSANVAFLILLDTTRVPSAISGLDPPLRVFQPGSGSGLSLAFNLLPPCAIRVWGASRVKLPSHLVSYMYITRARSRHVIRLTRFLQFRQTSLGLIHVGIFFYDLPIRFVACGSLFCFCCSGCPSIQGTLRCWTKNSTTVRRESSATSRLGVMRTLPPLPSAAEFS